MILGAEAEGAGHITILRTDPRIRMYGAVVLKWARAARSPAGPPADHPTG